MKGWCDNVGIKDVVVGGDESRKVWGGEAAITLLSQLFWAALIT